MHRAGKLGLGSAYVAGFKYALTHDYDHVVEMHADFSHRPADLPRLLAAGAKADVVIGSRNVAGGRTENWSLPRRVISRGGSLYARLLLSLPIKDCTSGFKCFSRRVLQALDLDAIASNGFGFQVEMNHLSSCRIPICRSTYRIPRPHGWSLQDVFKDLSRGPGARLAIALPTAK